MDVKFKRRLNVLVAEGRIAGYHVAVAKPRTFMNLSGEAVRYLTARYGARSSDVLVVFDDMNLPTGKIRIRPRGGAGGHKGVQSIIENMGTQEFARIRIGVGKSDGGDAIAHVLGNFSSDDLEAASASVKSAVEIIKIVLSEGLDKAMDKFN
jgi:PTH1 family peptidyl-tRNA hydrolase